MEPPPIAALYLVIFDQKIGYKLDWFASASTQTPTLSLDGIEYKSLPSGLHAVESDLVYFRHDQFAGISAFQRGNSDAAHRGADFVSVGALVEVGKGRLGRAWGHARGLRRLAQRVLEAGDVDGGQGREEVLEGYWEAWRMSGKRGTVNGKTEMSAKDDKVKATEGVADGLDKTGETRQDHPALDMGALLDLCGPLLFPVYRAALCRKRILLLGSPPVRRSCNLAYELSVLSSLPQPAAETLDSSLEHLFRIKPLYSVGIHDIPELQSAARSEKREPMLACTTDDILGEKKDLYDVLIQLPTSPLRNTGKRWPTIRTSDGRVLKATQRDLRRYRALRRELQRMRPGGRRDSMRYRDEDAEGGDDENEADDRPLLPSRRRSMSRYHEDGGPSDALEETVEGASWTTSAYQAFIWWASAGEQEVLEAVEGAMDQELLTNLPDPDDARPDSPYAKSSSKSDVDRDTEEAEYTATALTAYFHRLTTLIMTAMAAIVEEADDQTEEGIEEGSILIRADEIQRLGLDVWSENDKDFVKDVVKLYFDREVVLESGGIVVCGMRVC